MSKKLTAVTATSTAPASADLIYTVDVSDTSGGVSGTSKKLTVETLASQMVAVNGAATAKVAPWATAALLQTDLASLPVGFVAWTSDRPFPWRVVAVGSYVADGGITLVAGSRAAVLDFTGPIDVRWYGAAVGGSAATNAAMIQAAINTAAANKKKVTCDIEISVTSVRLKNGLRGFGGTGKLIASATTPASGVITTDGLFYSTPAVDNCEITDLTIDCNGLASIGLFAATLTNSLVSRLKVTGRGDADDNGIRLHWGSAGNVVSFNEVTIPTAEGFCIMASGDCDPDSGWYDGAITAVTNPPTNNTYMGNVGNGGLYGLGLFGSDSNEVVGNFFDNNSARAIGLVPNSSDNHVHHNQLTEYGSSAVHCAYGSSRNIIANNTCISTVSAGEASLQAYVAVSNNKFLDNYVDAPTNYGIYFAIDAVGNVARGNTINNDALVIAGAAIESDWAGTPPGGATGSRPNFVAVPGPRTEWPNGGSYDNEIVDNTFLGGTDYKPIIYLGQLGTFDLKRNIITDNKFRQVGEAYEMLVFEETSGDCAENILSDNKFSSPYSASFQATRGRAHFDYVTNNLRMNIPKYYYEGTINSATIDADPMDVVSTAHYTVATTVTTITGGIPGQTLEIKLSTYTTIQHNSLIKLRGGVDLVATSINEYLTLKMSLGNIWIEQSRTAA